MIFEIDSTLLSCPVSPDELALIEVFSKNSGNLVWKPESMHSHSFQSKLWEFRQNLNHEARHSVHSFQSKLWELGRVPTRQRLGWVLDTLVALIGWYLSQAPQVYLGRCPCGCWIYTDTAQPLWIENKSGAFGWGSSVSTWVPAGQTQTQRQWIEESGATAFGYLNLDIYVSAE